MDEGNLDDFFAKKDKTKKKTKTSKVTADDILAKQQTEPLDEEAGFDKPKKLKKKKKKDGDSGSSATDPQSNIVGLQGDEDWQDFQDEEEKDMSGLKIQSMQISRAKEDQEERAYSDKESGDEGGSGGDKGDGGVWNKADVPYEPPKEEPKAAPEPAPAPKEDGSAAKAPTKYVPPSLRRNMDAAAASGPTRQNFGRRKKEAPNMSSEMDFPSLNNVGHPEGGESKHAAPFETVKGGGRNMEDPRAQVRRVEVGNKYDALTRGDC